MRRRIVIRELEIPATTDAVTWPDFEAAMLLHYSNEALTYGTDDVAFTPEEALPGYLDHENQPTRLFVARAGDRIVGVGRYEIDSGDDPETAWMLIDVLPEHRGRGVGGALSDWLQSVAATDAIRKAIVYVPSKDGPGERITARTGYGSVPARNPEVRFLVTRGYRLEQVVRGSRLALPFDASARLRDAAETTGPEYRIHYWIDHTPKAWRTDMAMLRTRMSTEEPNAGLEEPEDVWTVERLIAHEERLAAGPRTRLVSAVEHVPAGTLIGFTALSAPAELTRSVAQDDTLVLPEHRGHRLGMLLKLANLDHLARQRPGHPSVITFNAEENRHMLDVNEAVGFVPIGYEGAWRKDLPY